MANTIKYDFGSLRIKDALKVRERDYYKTVNAALKFAAYHGLKFKSDRKTLTIIRVK